MMDPHQRRPSYPQPPPQHHLHQHHQQQQPPPPPAGHQHHQHQHHLAASASPAAAAPPPQHHYHPQQQLQQQQQQQQPPPPPPPPPQHQPHQAYQPSHLPAHISQHPAQQAPQQHPYYVNGPPPPPHPPPPPSATHAPAPSGPALPPIQASHDQKSLPPIRQSPSQSHVPRDGSQEGQSQYSHNRSGHATPANVARPSYPPPPHEHTPTTPNAPYPPASAPDGAQAHPQPTMIDHSATHPAHGYPPPPPPPSGGYVSHALPGPPAPPPHHHEQQPPPYMTPVADHHPQYPPGPMYNPNYGPAASGGMYGPNGPKRKQMRATQACEQCRQRKQKCDEGAPCSFCKENSLPCQYRDTPPAKTDKNMEKLINMMESQVSGFQELSAKIDTLENRMRRVEQNGTARPSSQPVDQHEADLLEQQEHDRIRKKPQLDDHRTAPHKLLLLWPKVRPLLQAAGVRYNDGYVMEAEDRGMLRLWNIGEAVDELDGTQGGGAMPTSPARSEENGGYGHTPPFEGRWGTGIPASSPDLRGQEPVQNLGGLNPNGELDLDVKTIWTLYDCYMRHMHIMHPIVDKRRLTKLFKAFCDRHGTGRARATFAVGISSLDADTRPMKRQRSNGSSAIGMPMTDSSDSSRTHREPIERSPINAVILLILALGKICMHKDPLPGPVRSHNAQASNTIMHSLGIRGHGNPNTSFTASSPASVDIKPSPSSTKSTPNTHPTPPSENGYRFDPPPPPPRPDRNGAKNIDVLPGLAYYAKAAEILGAQSDGNDLIHVQMFLLAGLYKGQLARVKESLSWITMAGRAILTLLDRYKLYNENYWTAYGDVRKQHETGQARIKDVRQALIVLASWTCLQLEMDILAEMKLPPSGIQNVEALLLMPHKAPDDESYVGLEPDGRTEDYDNILMYYCAQLFLRRRLNRVHSELYGPGWPDQPVSEVRAMLLSHEDILGAWRGSLPPHLKWNDDDPPPSDILDARLRAKYWGARYVINRPFLDYALHIMPYVKDNQSTVEQIALDAYGNPRDKADVHLFKAIQQLGDSAIWQGAKRCIDAAMHSTVAFDGVPDRLIVTNIHGTAHAQFGNMLVLSATFHTHYLQALVPLAKFKTLLFRTIRFLRRLSPISPTCQADCIILEKFQNILFPGAEEESAVYDKEGLENHGMSADPMST